MAKITTFKHKKISMGRAIVYTADVVLMIFLIWYTGSLWWLLLIFIIAVEEEEGRVDE